MSVNITSSVSDENEGEEEYEFEYEEYMDENEDENDYEDEDENEDFEEYEEMEEEEGEDSSTVVNVEDTSSSQSDVKRKLKSMKKRKKTTRKSFSTSNDEDDSSYHYNDRFYSPRIDEDSSGGNYFSAEGNTRDDLHNFFGIDREGRKGRTYANWQNSDDSFEPVDEIDFRGVNLGDYHMKNKYKNKERYRMMEEKSMYLKSRIRNLKRLLEKGGLDPAVEAVELKKIRRLEQKLQDLDYKLNNRSYNYESHLEDFKDKLKVIRRMKTKHKDVVHGLRQIRFERDTKGTSNNKRKNNLNQQRVYIESKIKKLGGFVSEDSEYSVGSWDSVEEDRGKEGTFFLVVDRPSALDVPKEKQRNGAVFYNPNEGEPSIRKFKGIKDLQNEIEEIIKEANRLAKLRKGKGLKKLQREYLDKRIQTLLNRVDKLKQLQSAKIDPSNLSKHKRLGQLYLRYFDISDNITQARSDKNADPELIKKLLGKRKKIREEIIRLEKELATSINRDEDDSTHEEINEKWKLVDEAKEKFARSPKFYNDPYTVNDMLDEAKKLEIKAEKLWYEEPHTRENRYRVRKNIGRILNIFDDLTSLNRPHYPHSGYNMYHPNIDIENYYPWDGRYRNWSSKNHSETYLNGSNKNKNNNGDKNSEGNGSRNLNFIMDKKLFRNGLPLIYDKYLHTSHFRYPDTKLLHYGPLTNSNGNKELVFLFEDRLICTRVNTLNDTRFHYKNEIYLDTGELAVKMDADKLDEKSFLPEYNQEKEKKSRKKNNNKHNNKNISENEMELLDLENNDVKSIRSVSNPERKDSELNLSSNDKKPKKKSKHKKDQKHSKHFEFSSDQFSVRNPSDSSSDSNSSSDDSSSDEDDSSSNYDVDYYCFLVVNGRKGKFFYATSKAEMKFWVKQIQTIVDKQKTSNLKK